MTFCGSSAATRNSASAEQAEVEGRLLGIDPAVFGDIADPGSRVSKMRRSNLSYGLLAELGTRPRTEYLAALTNPNADLPEVTPA